MHPQYPGAARPGSITTSLSAQYRQMTYRSLLLLPPRGSVNLLQYLERHEVGKVMMAASKEVLESLEVAMSGVSLPAFNNIQYKHDADDSTSMDVLRWAIKRNVDLRSFDIYIPTNFEVPSIHSTGEGEDTEAGINILYLLLNAYDVDGVDIARAYIRGNDVDVKEIVLDGCHLEEYLLITDNSDTTTPELLGMILEEGLAKGLDVNRPFRNLKNEGKSEWNSLSYCSATEMPGCLKVLLDSGGAPNHRRDFNSDPLVCACRGNKLLSASLLIDSGADVNISADSGMTPLGWACVNKSEKMVQLLIKNGAETNITDGEGRSLLTYCAYKENERIALMLLDAGADPLAVAQADGVSCLHWCAWHGLNNLALRILQHPTCDTNAVNCHGETALFISCVRQKLQVAKTLFHAGADFLMTPSAGDNEGVRPLHVLLKDGNDDLALIFITKSRNRTEEGALSMILSDPFTHLANDNGTGTLLHTLAGRDRDMENTFIDEYDEVRVVQDKPGQHTEAIYNALVERGTDINALDSNNISPLFSAAEHGNLPLIDLLLRSKAKTHNGRHGRGYLFGAVLGGHTSTVQALVEERHQDVDEQDQLGDTPLHIAVRQGFDSVINFLIDCDADVDMVNHSKTSPLMEAITGARVPSNITMSRMIFQSQCKQNLLELDPLLLHKVVEADARYSDVEDNRTVMMLSLQKYCDLRYDIPDADGNTVVHKCIELDRRVLLTCFADCGADLRSSGGRSQLTPLQLVYLHASIECLEDVVESVGNDQLTEVDEDGNTLLHILAQANVANPERNVCEEMAKHLLNAGLPVDSQNSSGKTPLYLASQNGNFALCTYLLFDALADPAIQSEDGTTAMMVAVNEEIQNLLAIMSMQSGSGGNTRRNASSSAGASFQEGLLGQLNGNDEVWEQQL